MKADIDARLSSVQVPSTPEQALAVYEKIADEVRPKYYTQDGKPLPYDHKQ